MHIDGDTSLLAHVGCPTSTFKAPMIYYPYFESIGLDACVVPMGVKVERFTVALPQIFAMSNVHAALITMPHKIPVLALLDEVSTAVKIAGSCNARDAACRRLRAGADCRMAERMRSRFGQYDQAARAAASL